MIGSEKSLAYNPTVTSSLTNPMNLVSSNNPLEITQQQMFTPVTNSNYNAGVKVANQPPQGIAGLKSRILHGQAMNKN